MAHSATPPLITTGAAAMKNYPKKIGSLTSLRFFAALWVIMLHFTYLPSATIKDVPIINRGTLGVDFFFMLSGFIMTHSHFHQITKGEISFFPFIGKRLAKIYPMHLATLLFYVLLLFALTICGLKIPNPERYGTNQFILNILLIHAWQFTDVGSWNFPSWSVSAEWAAYLIFPFCAISITRSSIYFGRQRTLLIAAASLIASVIIAPLLFKDSFFELHSNFGWYRVFGEFLLGIAMYNFGTRANIAKLSQPAVFASLIAALLISALFEQLVLCVGIIGLIIMSAAESSRQGTLQWLESPVLIYLGEVSYSLYLVHIPVANVTFRLYEMRFGKFPLWFLIVGLLITLAVAMLAYHLIEKPAHRYLVDAIKRRESRPGLN